MNRLVLEQQNKRGGPLGAPHAAAVHTSRVEHRISAPLCSSPRLLPLPEQQTPAASSTSSGSGQLLHGRAGLLPEQHPCAARAGDAAPSAGQRGAAGGLAPFTTRCSSRCSNGCCTRRPGRHSRRDRVNAGSCEYCVEASCTPLVGTTCITYQWGARPSMRSTGHGPRSDGRCKGARRVSSEVRGSGRGSRSTRGRSPPPRDHLRLRIAVPRP